MIKNIKQTTYPKTVYKTSFCHDWFMFCHKSKGSFKAFHNLSRKRNILAYIKHPRQRTRTSDR